MKTPAGVEFSERSLIVDGVQFSYAMLAELLYELAHPDPRKWFRFETLGDRSFINIRLEEQGPMMRCASCGYVTSHKHHVYCPKDGFILNTAPHLEASYGHQENNQQST